MLVMKDISYQDQHHLFIQGSISITAGSINFILWTPQCFKNVYVKSKRQEMQRSMDISWSLMVSQLLMQLCTSAHLSVPSLFFGKQHGIDQVLTMQSDWSLGNSDFQSSLKMRKRYPCFIGALVSSSSYLVFLTSDLKENHSYLVFLTSDLKEIHWSSLSCFSPSPHTSSM